MANRDENNLGMQGEGNKQADKRYRDEAAEFAKSGKVEQEAKKAERDIEQNPEEYEAAEREGKRHSAGDLEKDLRGSAKPDADLKGNKR